MTTERKETEISSVIVPAAAPAITPTAEAVISPMIPATNAASQPDQEVIYRRLVGIPIGEQEARNALQTATRDTLARALRWTRKNPIDNDSRLLTLERRLRALDRADTKTGRKGGKKSKKTKAITKDAAKAARREAKLKALAVLEEKKKETAQQETEQLHVAGRKIAAIYKTLDGRSRRDTQMAIDAGTLLDKKKQELPSINSARISAGLDKILWGGWLAAHEIHPRRAQRDMKLAEFFGSVTWEGPLPPLTDAYIVAGALKPGKEPAPPAELSPEEEQAQEIEREHIREHKAQQEREFERWYDARDHRIKDVQPLLTAEVSKFLSTIGGDANTPTMVRCLANQKEVKETAAAVAAWGDDLPGDAVVVVVTFKLAPTAATKVE